MAKQTTTSPKAARAKNTAAPKKRPVASTSKGRAPKKGEAKKRTTKKRTAKKRTTKKPSASKARTAQKQDEQAYQSALEEVRKLFAQLNKADVLGRHAIGQKIVEFSNDPTKYGKQLVERLATGLKMDASTLYEYGRVAEAWSADELKAQLKNSPGNSGEPLSWSHFAAAAQMTDKKSRNKLAEEARTEGLSVRQLKARRAERSTSGGGEKANDAVGSPSSNSAAKETSSSTSSDLGQIRQLGVRNAQGAVEGAVSQLKRFQELHKDNDAQLSQEQKQQLRDFDTHLVEAEECVKSTRACIVSLLKQSTKSGAKKKPAEAPAKKSSPRKGRK